MSEFTASALVDYHHDFGGGRLSASVNGFYSSSVRLALESRVTQKEYFQGNARIGWSPTDSGATFSLFTRNFTNAKVLNSVFINPSADAVIYSAPRQIGVAVNYSF